VQGTDEDSPVTQFHATGTVSEPAKLGPYVDEEMKILADLKGEGVVEHSYRRSQAPGVLLIVNAADAADAQRQLARLPFVTLGLLTFDLTPIYEI
jgi:hypothetical protein